MILSQKIMMIDKNDKMLYQFPKRPRPSKIRTKYRSWLKIGFYHFISVSVWDLHAKSFRMNRGGPCRLRNNTCTWNTNEDNVDGNLSTLYFPLEPGTKWSLCVEARTITNIEPISFPTSSQLCFNNNETGLPHQFATWTRHWPQTLELTQLRIPRLTVVHTGTLAVSKNSWRECHPDQEC